MKAGLIILLVSFSAGLMGQQYEPIHLLEGHGAKVQNLTFSPDGNFLASGDRDGKILIWNVGTGELVRQWQGHDAIVVDFSFDAAGERMATASNDGTAKVWDVATGILLGTYYNTHVEAKDGEGWAVSFAVFSKDGVFLFFGGDGATIFRAELGRTETGANHAAQAVYSYPTKCKLQRVTGGELMDANRIICSIGYHVKIINLTDGREEKSFYYPNEPLNDVVLGPETGQFSTWSLDGVTTIWDIASGNRVKTFAAGDYMEICSPSFSGHRQLMATAANGHEAHVWDIAKGKKVATLMAHTDIVRIAKYSPNQDIIATASYDGTVRIWQGPGFPMPEPKKGGDTHLIAKNGDTPIDLHALMLPVLHFDQSQYILRAESRTDLRKVAAILKAHPHLLVVVEGHTDDTGHPQKNDRLSNRRATVVKNFLVEEGVEEHRIQTQSHGSDRPTHLNSCEESKQHNRRVEMSFAKRA